MRSNTGSKATLLIKIGFQKPYETVPLALTAHDLKSAVAQIQRIEADENGYCLMLGAFNPRDDRVLKAWLKDKHVRRTKNEEVDKNGKLKLPCYIEVPRHLYMIDFDPTDAQLAWCREQGLNVFLDPERAVRACTRQFLPRELQHCAYAYQLSASAGLVDNEKTGGVERDGARVKFHVFVWLKVPRMPSVIKAWVALQDGRNVVNGFGDYKSIINKGTSKEKCAGRTGGLDLSLYQAV
jgi:hypothetical protein